jgi:YXWGXW repeat-containing protein
MIRIPRLFLLALLCPLPIGGCYVEARPVPVEGETVYDSEPPPPPPAEVEVIPAPPGPEFVWIGGYHRWNGRRYVWVRGRYEHRPHSRAHWEASHWEARGRAHVWVEGRWR